MARKPTKPGGKTAARKPARKSASKVATVAATPAPVRLARVARGKKPQYFADPAVDKLLSIVMTLAGELSVTRDRLDTVERLLSKKRVLSAADVDAYQPDEAATRARDARRSAYLDRLLRAVQTELEELTDKGMPRSQDEVIAAVSD